MDKIGLTEPMHVEPRRKRKSCLGGFFPPNKYAKTRIREIAPVTTQPPKLENVKLLRNIGADWIAERIGKLTERLNRVTPTAFNEANRYLPESVTSIPGYIRYAVNPYMREIVDCFDVDSPVREVNLKKGVQITYTTVLESGLLYYMAHVKTLPLMYMTADKELADARVENNIIPMLNESGFRGIIRSSDVGNSRKTGKTKNHIQFEGGGYLVPFGANSADKMRSFSIAVLLKDEIDAWADTVGKDGDPDKLSDARCSGYWPRRKIFRGSTPLVRGTSKIDKQFLRGDQRRYMVRCQGTCNKSFYLRWSRKDQKGCFKWDLDDGVLVPDSVRFVCPHCGKEHFEYDKPRLFATEHGAYWKPFGNPVEPGIRSYHLPAMYSPIGMQPWAKCVADYLEAFDPEARKVKDVGKLQVFYNNILAESFEVQGSRVTFVAVSAHRRGCYLFGQIPNTWAREHAGGPVLLVTCQVDVHKRDLRVATMGWVKDAKPFVIEYRTLEAAEGEPDCEDINCPVWGRLRSLIEEHTYEADDGRTYGIAITLIDAGYKADTVVAFCSDYASGVYPIMGRERPAKFQRIQEFAKFKTQAGTTGYRILVDHYKDRLGPVLRREWTEGESGVQKPYHFNAPLDITDAQLKELTAEVRREKKDERGNVTYEWHRPGGAANELWDLLVYGHAGVEILAWQICVERYELETIDWPMFWEYLESERLFFTEKEI